jgi:hypothetical protein
MKELQERKQLRVDDVPEELESSARAGGGGSTSSLLVPVVA